MEIYKDILVKVRESTFTILEGFKYPTNYMLLLYMNLPLDRHFYIGELSGRTKDEFLLKALSTL